MPRSRKPKLHHQKLKKFIDRKLEWIKHLQTARVYNRSAVLALLPKKAFYKKLLKEKRKQFRELFLDFANKKADLIHLKTIKQPTPAAESEARKTNKKLLRFCRQNNITEIQLNTFYSELKGFLHKLFQTK